MCIAVEMTIVTVSQCLKLQMVLETHEKINVVEEGYKGGKH